MKLSMREVNYDEYNVFGDEKQFVDEFMRTYLSGGDFYDNCEAVCYKYGCFSAMLEKGIMMRLGVGTEYYKNLLYSNMEAIVYNCLVYCINNNLVDLDGFEDEVRVARWVKELSDSAEPMQTIDDICDIINSRCREIMDNA